MRKLFILYFSLLFGAVCTPSFAQDTASPQETGQSDKAPSTNIVSGVALDFLGDQKDIWTSPLHLKRRDVEWLAPVGIGAAALFATDDRISNAARSNTSLRAPSNFISGLGNIAPFAVPGAMWSIGALSHNTHAAETGRLAAEAGLDTEVVVQVLKFVTNRPRPNLSNNQSFPSGHAASAFALATVLSSEYHDKPLIVVGSYGFATAVGVARVGGLNHFPSDVLAGAVIGELIGRYVVHHHASTMAHTR
jgi:membrane-associated phospholipid phosphatase